MLYAEESLVTSLCLPWPHANVVLVTLNDWENFRSRGGAEAAEIRDLVDVFNEFSINEQHGIIDVLLVRQLLQFVLHLRLPSRTVQFVRHVHANFVRDHAVVPEPPQKRGTRRPRPMREHYHRIARNHVLNIFSLCYSHSVFNLRI